MSKNIKEITLETAGDKNYNNVRLVKLKFEFPCSWTVLHLNDLKNILRLWIIGEEEKYPQEKGFRGRWMLFDEIKKIFDEKPSNVTTKHKLPQGDDNQTVI